MCKYCNNKEYNLIIDIKIFEKEILIETQGMTMIKGLGVEKKIIKYCPLCGDELNS